MLAFGILSIVNFILSESSKKEGDLKLTSAKIANVVDGVRSIARQEEPIGHIQAKTELSQGLVLEKLSTSIGVLMVIFESRPDCVPQIAALAIRSGNGILMKGGKEADRSNPILHRIIQNAIKNQIEIMRALQRGRTKIK